jgi:hypothetical protein
MKQQLLKTKKQIQVKSLSNDMDNMKKKKKNQGQHM